MRYTRKQFQSCVDRAVADIPEALRSRIVNVDIVVEDQPDKPLCEELRLEDPAELMGLYTGMPLTERSVEDSISLPDRIVIFQLGCEHEADTETELIECIRTTVLHEIGHYFGLDEDELEELGYG